MLRSIKAVIVCGLLGLATTTYAQGDFDGQVEEQKGRNILGSFGQGLSRQTSFVNFNGYITNEFKSKEGSTPTFDQHYFNIFISSQLTERIFAEGQLEYEHAGQEVELRYAFLDYKVSNAVIIRSGYFLTPAGEFNEYRYPEFLTKTIERAFINREISPSAWGEVGVQVRGQLGDPNAHAVPFYSLYVVNGLQGESGAGIRSLRGNDRDDNDNKAFGGNFGVDLGSDIRLSANAYSGNYDLDNELNLAIYGLSFYLDKEKFSVWGELQAASQQVWDDPDIQTTTSTLNKNGFFLLAGYMLTPKWEPVIRYDQINLDGAPEADRSRFTLGLNYHMAKNAIAKINYDITSNDGTEIDDNQFSLQVSVGF